jgi:RNA polymerase sigma-70 factor (ECF subfamily)
MPGNHEKARAVDRDGEVFLRAVDGDAAAFAAFLARYERRIARIVRACVPAGDAEDAFQEVCLRLLTGGRTYDAARPLVPWLDAVTRRVCAAAGRRRRRRSRELAMGAADSRLAASPGVPPDPFLRDAVQRYLAGRPRKERRAVRLVLSSGLTQREAAARLGVPPGTVACWLSRGVRAVREMLRIDHDL